MTKKIALLGATGSIGRSTLDVVRQYPDRAEISQWAYEALCWMTMNNIISGITDGETTILNPQGSATRAQVATIFWRFCENMP